MTETAAAPAPTPATTAPQSHLSIPAILALVAVAAACLQARIGGQTTKVGEEVGLGIPVATVVLGLCLLAAAAVSLRHWRLPPMSRWQVAFMAAVCLGLAGMSRGDLRPAVKELVQLGEIGAVAWLLGACISDASRGWLLRAWGWLGFVLLLVGLAGVDGIWPLGLSVARWSGLVIIATPFLLYALRPAPVWLRWPVLVLSAIAVSLHMEHAALAIAWCLVAGLAAQRLPGFRLPVAVAVALVVAIALPPPPAGWGIWSSLRPQYDATHTKRLVLETRAAFSAPAKFPLGAGLGAYKAGINDIRAGHPDQPSPAETTVPRDGNSQYLLLLVESGPLAPLCFLLLLLVAAALLRSRARAKPELVEITHVVAIALVAVAVVAAFTTVLGRGSGIWIGLLLGLAATFTAAPTADGDERAAPVDRGAGWSRFGWRLLPVGMVASACLVVMLAHNTSATDIDPRSRANQRLASLWSADPHVDLQPSSQATAYGVPILDLRPDAPDATRLIRVEGEAYTDVTGAFRQIQDNDASGHVALEIPADSGKAKGRASYSVDLAEAGTYRLAARVYWEDGCSNSLAFRIQGTPCGVSSELFSRWHELRSPTLLTLPAGPIEIHVENLEDGVRLDYFYLQRLGPALESAAHTPAAAATDPASGAM